MKSGIQGKIPANQLAELWLKLIDEVIEDTRYGGLPISTSQPRPQTVRSSRIFFSISLKNAFEHCFLASWNPHLTPGGVFESPWKAPFSGLLPREAQIGLQEASPSSLRQRGEWMEGKGGQSDKPEPPSWRRTPDFYREIGTLIPPLRTMFLIHGLRNSLLFFT